MDCPFCGSAVEQGELRGKTLLRDDLELHWPPTPVLDECGKLIRDKSLFRRLTLG